jgi:hypothetical protein
LFTDVRLRDDVVRALTHIGRSAVFSRVSGGARWKVSWSDASVARFDAVATPSTSAARGELVVRAIDAPVDVKRVWCFDVGGGLLVVRRAQRVSAARFHAGECASVGGRRV